MLSVSRAADFFDERRFVSQACLAACDCEKFRPPLPARDKAAASRAKRTWLIAYYPKRGLLSP